MFNFNDLLQQRINEKVNKTISEKSINYNTINKNIFEKSINCITINKTISEKVDKNNTINKTSDKSIISTEINEEINKTKHYSKNENLIKYFKPIPSEVKIIEPFVGNGDLLKILNIPFEKVECYDITNYSDYFPNFTQQDTLLNSVIKTEFYIVTNPPYLAKNKLSKELKEKYNSFEYQDLYQIFIKQLINTTVLGGILVLPLNFLVGKQTEKLRNEFLNIYEFNVINIFEHQVFENTTSAICSLQFNKKSSSIKPICHLFSSETVEKEFDFNILNKTIFTEFPIENLDKLDIKINRFYKTSLKPTKLRIHLLDNKLTKIYAEVLDEIPNVEDKISDRTIMTICSNKEFDEKEVSELFNELLDEFRNETLSLSLSSYREFNRKRLTFEEATHLLLYIMSS